MKPSVLVFSAVLATVLSATAIAQVQPGDSAPAQLTMAQAVGIAGTMGNGQAVRARLDARPAAPVYRVTVQPRGGSGPEAAHRRPRRPHRGQRARDAGMKK